MTEEEKKRLESLLQDSDGEEEAGEEKAHRKQVQCHGLFI